MSMTFRISTGRGLSLWASLQAGARTDLPLIILCHGLGNASDHPLIRTMRASLVKQGYPVLVFDFAGHGKSGGGVKDRTVRNFVADLSACVERARERNFAEHGIVLVGYSIGALASLIVAASHPKSIIGVTLIACNAEAKQKQKILLAKKKIKMFKRYSMIGSTKVAKNFWNDRNRFEPKGFAKKLHVPTLLICGSQDHTNPPEDSRLLSRWIASTRKKCVSIPHADHYFKPVAHQRAVVKQLHTWLAQNR